MDIIIPIIIIKMPVPIKYFGLCKLIYPMMSVAKAAVKKAFVIKNNST
jgi:hypothetical protein